MIPDGATFEAEIAPGVALYDVSEILPQHPTKRWGMRDLAGIDALFVHHSGANGPPGFRGLMGSARYVISAKNWPGTSYHFWAPYDEQIDPDGRIILYRGQADESFCWHTGGCNRRGMSIALQGNLTKTGPSPSQIETLEALIPWWCDIYGTTPAKSLSWHSDADRFGGRPKASCPGPAAVQWLTKYRDQ